MSTFFSVIIPVFNSEATLSAALNSIISQTFTDKEIVLIDGASADGTLNIIAGFQQANPGVMIKLLSEPDRGIYDAMNKGIKMASGQWLYFTGADDTLASATVLQQVYDEIAKEPVDLIYGNVSGIDTKTKYVYDTVNKVVSTGIHHQSVFYKAALFNTIGYYDPGFKVAADYHLTLKVFFNNSFKTKYVDLDIARFGEGGLSSQIFDYKFFSYHYKYLSQNKAVDKLEDPAKCLDNSVYCCLFLIKEKHDADFARTNLWYYLTRKNQLSLVKRLKAFKNMIYWRFMSALLAE